MGASNPDRASGPALRLHIDTGATLGDIIWAVERDPALVAVLKHWSRRDVEPFQ